jgi:hypothetical protein
MEWISEKSTRVISINEPPSEWEELTLVWKGFILVKMTVIGGKVFMLTESPKRYKDNSFSFIQSFLNREDVENVKQEIIELFQK